MRSRVNRVPILFRPGCSAPTSGGHRWSRRPPGRSRLKRELEIFRGDPDSEERVTAATFPSEIGKLLQAAEKIENVKFKVTRIESPRLPGSTVVSDVIYTILGQGKDGESLQWKGDWRLNWQKDHVGRWKLSRLKVLSTSRGRSVRDAFTEVTQRALGKEQLLPATTAAGSRVLAGNPRLCRRNGYLWSQWRLDCRYRRRRR